MAKLRLNPSQNPNPRYWGTMNAFRVLTQVLELAQIPVGPDCRPPSRWMRHSKGREEEGVLAKAVKLAERVRLVRVTPEVVEAEVPSESDLGVTTESLAIYGGDDVLKGYKSVFSSVFLVSVVE